MKTDKMKKNCKEAARFFKYLSHPQRLMILCHLSEGEKNVTELQNLTGISQSQTSQFLGRMELEGFIKCRKDGAKSYYLIKDQRIVRALEAFQKIFQ